MHATMMVGMWMWLAAAEAGDVGKAPPASSTPPALLRAPQPLSRGSEAGEPSADQYQLTRANDGSGDLIYQAPGFSARIARDGSVTFHDKHVSALHFIPARPSGAPTGVPTLEGIIRHRGKLPPKDSSKPADPTADETRYPSTTVSRYRPDPREACTYPRPCFFNAAAVLVGPGGSADITDVLMRLHGKDPYRYAKARFLAATQPMRIRLAGRAHAEDIRRSAADLPRRLTDIVCDRRLPLQERRGIVTALGDELDASPEADRSRAAISQALRRLDQAATAGADAPADCPSDVSDAPTRSPADAR